MGSKAIPAASLSRHLGHWPLRNVSKKEGLQAFVWAMAPSALGVRHAACGVRLTVSRSLTEARRHRDPTAVENKLGEEPRGSELPLALSGLGIRQTWASVRPGHPSDLGIPQTWASLRPVHLSDLKIPQI